MVWGSSPSNCIVNFVNIFNIHPKIIAYIINKDLDLSEYTYLFSKTRSRNKKLVIFGTPDIKKFIILILSKKHHSFNVYPCSIKNKDKWILFSNIKINKNITDNLVGKELQKAIEIINEKGKLLNYE